MLAIANISEIAYSYFGWWARTLFSSYKTQ